MIAQALAESWVIYRIPSAGAAVGRNGVCSQEEWVQLEAKSSGKLTLIRDGFTSEGEAERLARGTTGDKKPRFPVQAARRPDNEPD